jgi:tetratricopeptide (TPR) repeat protein
LKKTLSLFLILTVGLLVKSQDAYELHETGMKFLVQGDFDNAVLVLKRSVEKEPANTTYVKDLAYAYFLKGDAPSAKSTISPLVDKDNADERVYVLAGNILELGRELKDAEKMYKKGIKRFEKSGPLYNALGELLWNQQDYSAIKQWEKGIENDPEYAGNYYHACRHYFLTNSAEDKIWAVLYGEVFVNMESFSTRTVEVKSIIRDSYKRLFQDSKLFKDARPESFTGSYLTTLGKNLGAVSLGVDTESLLNLRTRFVLDWFQKTPVGFPHQLFEWHRQLLREGLFSAYHQWLFESVNNLAAFENWTRLYSDEYQAFTRYRQNKLFKMPVGQYYR